MYNFLYHNDHIQRMLSDRKTYWDPELEDELKPVLKKLKHTGEITGANCGSNLIAPGKIYFTLLGRTFQLGYTVNPDSREIKFYEFQQVSHQMDWEMTLEKDLLDGEEQPIYIPQIGDPLKFIRTIELIHSGINTSLDLGIAFRSSAKKEKDIARRGDYLGRPVIELGLASRSQIDKQSSSIYVLTDRGRRIAQSNDSETRERLIAEALLGFYPIQIIIEETTRGEKELNKELIQEIISLVSFGDCGGTTNPRRASSLRALVNWVTRWAGIPIRREGNDGIQLYIPYIYAN